jgi:hypothetical protein
VNLDGVKVLGGENMSKEELETAEKKLEEQFIIPGWTAQTASAAGS